MAREQTQIRTVRRDPFARTEVVRQRVEAPASASCAWCGSTGRLYHYGSETDGGRRHIDTRRCFCSTSCYDAYH